MSDVCMLAEERRNHAGVTRVASRVRRRAQHAQDAQDAPPVQDSAALRLRVREALGRLQRVVQRRIRQVQKRRMAVAPASNKVQGLSRTERGAVLRGLVVHCRVVEHRRTAFSVPVDSARKGDLLGIVVVAGSVKAVKRVEASFTRPQASTLDQRFPPRFRLVRDRVVCWIVQTPLADCVSGVAPAGGS